MRNNNSPYTAAITGCSFLFYEFQRMLPLLLSEERDKLVSDEIENNQILQINSRKARRTFVLEFKRRFASVPVYFWDFWQNMSEAGQRIGLFYVIMKTYKLIFDFHINVTMKKWNSINHQILKSDIMMEFYEIASRDEFVNSWSDNTKSRCASAYLTILRQAGLLEEKTNTLKPIKLNSNEFAYYIRTGEEWFLEACFLYPYEIKDIKTQVL
jgi:hypothetical protein